MTAQKIMFLSEACILDPNSGAAIEMLGWLNILTAHGYDCSSVTMSIFDGPDEFPLRQEIFPDVDFARNVGNRIRTRIQNVEHNVIYAGTTVGPKVPVHLINKFISAAAEDIRRIRPDVVVCYGGRNLIPLLKLAGQQGARTVFYLCNASYHDDKREVFSHIDQIVTPSQALRDLYRDRFGFSDVAVVHNRVQPFVDRKALTQKRFLERQRNGFVTMINPALLKGVTVFLQVANAMQARRSDVTFLAVESRGTQQEVESLINGARQIKNIWWVQRQMNMRTVLARTAVLLVPSIYFEAAGRVIAEAQLAGIPVLATRNGGIPEQMNGAGFLFDIPAGFTGDSYYHIPSLEEVKPWVDRIDELMSDDAKYLAASKRALAAGAAFAPEAVNREILDLVGFPKSEKAADDVAA